MSAAITSRRADDGELADLVSAGAAALGLRLADRDVGRLLDYVRLIERWNAAYNLTAVRDPRDMVVQHVLDCLAAAAALGRRNGAGSGERLIDVGSGAGLPGIVIAIAWPEREVTCVDSVGKKSAFITQAAGTLGVGNVRALHARVERIADRFDVVVSRAFASLADFVAATAHVLEESGTWMAMKGKAPTAEIAGLSDALTFHVEPIVVPRLEAERCVVWMKQSREASARL